RGRYAAAVARMEAVGIPFDVAAHARLICGWDSILGDLFAAVDQEFGVHDGRKLNARRLRDWAREAGIRWRILPGGKLDLSLEAFRDVAKVHPEVTPLKEVRASKTLALAVGADGRHRCPLRPFASKTGRNQPSSNGFVFGPARWVRRLIRPAPGMA